MRPQLDRLGRLTCALERKDGSGGSKPHIAFFAPTSQSWHLCKRLGLDCVRTCRLFSSYAAGGLGLHRVRRLFPFPVADVPLLIPRGAAPHPRCNTVCVRPILPPFYTLKHRLDKHIVMSHIRSQLNTCTYISTPLYYYKCTCSTYTTAVINPHTFSLPLNVDVPFTAS